MHKNLTQSELKKHLSYDLESGIFTRIFSASSSVKIGDVAGCIGSERYTHISVAGIKYAAHRLAWLYVHGVWPHLYIDHKDGVRSNNKFANLRECTVTENLRNRKQLKNNRSGFKGVSWQKQRGKWKVQARLDGKKLNLGYFDNLEQAGAAYQNFARKNHGEFYKEST